VNGVAKSTTIPNYLVASTPLGLRRLMLLNNRKQSAYLEYDIMFVNGRWYAWYIADIAALQNSDDPITMQAQKESDGGNP
jgi:hypothetical protein